MTSTKEAFQLMCQNGMAAGAASAVNIAKAEAELGVLFPAQYKEFLAEFGAVLVESLEIYGLVDPVINDPPMWVDVVDVTKKLREWEQAGTERKHLLPISDDGTGVYFFLNTAHFNNSEIWGIGPGIDEVVANCLYQFAADHLAGNLSFQ